MEETFPIVVEHVLTVVGAVKQCAARIERCEIPDHRRQKGVGITDRIVVSVPDLLLVLPFDGHVVVGQEVGCLARITLVIAEMRPVTMQDEEQVVLRIGLDDAFHRVEQLHVVTRMPHIDKAVGIARQFVDHRPLRRLVRKKPRAEARFVEERGQSLATEEFVVFVRPDRREDHRHALVRGIALREHVAEHDDLVSQCLQAGIRGAVITVQLPIGGTRRFADHIDVDLPLVGLRRTAGMIAEPCRRAVVILDLDVFARTEHDVIGHVDRKDLVAEHMPFRLIGRNQQSRPDERQHASDHGRPAAETRRKVDLTPHMHGCRP